MYRLLIIVLPLFLFSACEQKLSGESKESYQESLIRISEKLNEEQKIKFTVARNLISFSMMREHKIKSDNKEEILKRILEIFDNKTYDDVITMAESFLQKEKKLKIKALNAKIDELHNKMETVKNSSSVLEAIQPDIKIIESTSFGTKIPLLVVNFTNTSDTLFTDKYGMIINITSIHNKREYSRIEKGNNSILIKKGDTINTSQIDLSPLLKRSEQLANLFKNAKYPITNLSLYGLDVIAGATTLTTNKGTIYVISNSEIEDIKVLNTLNKKLRSIQLDKEMLQLSNKNLINKVMKLNEVVEQDIILNGEVTISFPNKYDVALSNNIDISSIDIDTEPIFSNLYKGSIDQYSILNTENNTKGVLIFFNTKEENIEENIKIVRSNLEIIDIDRTGYIYKQDKKYNLLRYFRFNDTHYIYLIAFSDIHSCVKEFNRSRFMIKNCPI